MKHESTKPPPTYIPAPTKRVRIGGVACVEVDGQKWVEMLKHIEFYTRGKRL